MLSLSGLKYPQSSPSGRDHKVLDTTSLLCHLRSYSTFPLISITHDMSSVPNNTASVSPTPFSYSVAIVGGGIGGLTLALGLLKYSHIDVQIYESAPSFGWIGAGVAIGPNGQRALELISPAAKEAFDKHATPNMWCSKAKNFAAYIVVSPCRYLH